jgi:integrase
VAKAHISKRVVDAAAPADRDAFVWDDELVGFGLKVTPSGRKSYIFQYRMGGRSTPTRRYTIGRHGAGLTPDLARDRAKKLAALIVNGVDPLEQERSEREQRQEAERLAERSNVRAVVDRFVETHVAANWSSEAAAAVPLRRNLVGLVGDKLIAEVTKADIAEVVDSVPARQAASRRKLWAIMSKFFHWAAARGEIEASPMDGMEAPPTPPSRDRVLSDDELRLAWKATAKLNAPFGPLYRLLIITGQRRDEVAGLDWSELDRPSAVWRLPKERAKNGKASDIPLSTLAVAELDRLAGVAGAGEATRKWPRRGLVFTTTRETAVSGFSRAKRRWDAALAQLAADERDEPIEAISIPRWTIHDLRRTLATGLQRLGVRFEVTEAVLNHVSGARSGVAGVYQRYAWANEKRAALDAWATHVRLIEVGLDEESAGRLIGKIARGLFELARAETAGTNVVPISAAARRAKLRAE